MDIMQAIIDIEKKAQGIVDSVDEMKNKNSSDIEKAVDEINSEYAEKLEKEKNELKVKYDVIRDKEMTKIERKYADRLEKLDEKCKQDKEKWVKGIFDAVVGSND